MMKPIIQTQFELYEVFTLYYADRLSSDILFDIGHFRELNTQITWNIGVPLANQIQIPLPGF